MKTTLCFLLLCAASISAICIDHNVYVSPNGTGVGTPEDPTDLQTALSTIYTAEIVNIHLLAGTYASAPYAIPEELDQTGVFSYNVYGGYDNTYQTADPATPSTITGAFQHRCLSLDFRGWFGYAESSISNLSILNGSAEEEGAGLRILSDAGSDYPKMYISQCTFRDNSTGPEGNGGAVYCIGSAYFTNCLLENNYAGRGAGIYLTSQTPGINEQSAVIMSSRFFDNVAQSSEGADLWTDQIIFIYGGVFDGTSGSEGGTAVYGINNQLAEIITTSFVHYRSPLQGTALLIEGADVTLIQCLVAENEWTGTEGMSAALYLGTCSQELPFDSRIINCTLANNAHPNGTGTHYSLISSAGPDDYLFIDNSIFSDTEASSVQAVSGSVAVSTSLLHQGQWTGMADLGNNFSGDPLFAGPSDYILQISSPAVDSGNNAVNVSEVTDLIGNPRFSGAAIDLGCYELSVAPQNIIADPGSIVENSTVLIFLTTLPYGDLYPCSYALVEGNGSNDADNDLFMINGNELVLLSAPDFEQTPTLQILVQSTDGNGASVQVPLVVAVTNINESPEIASNVEDTQALVMEAFSFDVADAFTDPDAGDVLTYSATLSDGSPLPAWLELDGGTFSGAAPEENVWEIEVTATDTGGLSASDTFLLSSIPNSMDDVDQPDYSVFPNPTAGHLRIQVPAGGMIRACIVDEAGRIVLNISLQPGSNELDVSRLASGNYSIQLQGRAEVLRFRKL